jgi:hypothetical protein
MRYLPAESEKIKTKSQLKLLPINLPDKLNKYNLVWDVGEDYISTFCNSDKTSQEVSQILKSYNIAAHRVKTDERIIVIYI